MQLLFVLITCLKVCPAFGLWINENQIPFLPHMNPQPTARYQIPFWPVMIRQPNTTYQTPFPHQKNQQHTTPYQSSVLPQMNQQSITEQPASPDEAGWNEADGMQQVCLAPLLEVFGTKNMQSLFNFKGQGFVISAGPPPWANQTHPDLASVGVNAKYVRDNWAGYMNLCGTAPTNIPVSPEPPYTTNNPSGYYVVGENPVTNQKVDVPIKSLLRCQQSLNAQMSSQLTESQKQAALGMYEGNTEASWIVQSDDPLNRGEKFREMFKQDSFLYFSAVTDTTTYERSIVLYFGPTHVPRTIPLGTIRKHTEQPQNVIAWTRVTIGSTTTYYSADPPASGYSSGIGIGDISLASEECAPKLLES